MKFIQAILVALVATLVVPGTALATNRLVSITGVDSGNCNVAASPCRHVAYALSKAGSGDQVLVGQGTYVEQVAVGPGITLAGTRGPIATIDGAAGTAVTLNGVGTAVKGLRLRGDLGAVKVTGQASTAVISGNTFDDTAVNSAGKLQLAAGSATVTHNTFVGPAGGATSSYGILANSDKALDIGFNSFANFFTSIDVAANSDASRNIHGNTITGIHGDSPSVGSGISLQGDGVVADNVLTGAAFNIGGASGITARDFNVPASLISKRNRVSGLPSAGIDAEFVLAGSTSTLDSDVLTGNTTGLEAFGAAPDVVGATIYDNKTSEVYLGNATGLKLTSSIVGAKGITVGTGTCTIAFSRGPTLAGNSCKTFQTTTPPGFAGPTDYRLTAASPLLDAGDPAAPAPGAIDIDGHPRAIVGVFANRCLAPRRDMGAYEFAPTPALTCPPPPDTKAPVLTKVSVPRRIVTGSRFRARFTISEAARVTLRFRRSVSGILSKGRCVAVPRHRPSHARSCTRLVRGGTLTVNARNGANSPLLRLKFGTHLAPVGPYRVDVVATDAAHNVSHPVRASTRVKPRPRRRHH